MSNEQCCLCGAVGHDSKYCKMYSVKVKGIHAVKGHAVPVEYAAGWDAALDAVQAARAQPAGQKLTKPVSIGGVRFHVGEDVSHVLRAAERRYEYEQSPEYSAQQAERVAQCMTAQPAEHDTMRLAEMVLSDCGCSTAISDRLQRRVAERIQRHIDGLLNAQPAGEAVADFYVVTGGYDHLHEWDAGRQWIATAEDIARLDDRFSKRAGFYAAPPAQVPDAVALLREMEWANNKWADCCPVCEEKKERGHAANCKLAAVLAAAPQPTQQPAQVPDVKAMVDRFLGWKLPPDFGPDAGISFKAPPHPSWWPTGTNLLTATQAEAMFRYVLAAAPLPKGDEHAGD